MNKQELIDQIAEGAELSKAEATRALDATVKAISDSLSRGSEVAIPGFGKWSVSERSAREGRNPATGEKITIAATKVPKFSAGAQLKAAVK